MDRKKYIKKNIDKPVGIKLPFSEVSNKTTDNYNTSNFIDSVSHTGTSNIFPMSYSTKEQIRYNISNLILTQKGERKLNLNFGIDWNYYIFNQKDEIKIQELKTEILDQVAFWLPFVDVKVNVISEKSMYYIKILYKLKIESSYDEENSILLNAGE